MFGIFGGSFIFCSFVVLMLLIDLVYLLVGIMVLFKSCVLVGVVVELVNNLFCGVILILICELGIIVLFGKFIDVEGGIIFVVDVIFEGIFKICDEIVGNILEVIWGIVRGILGFSLGIWGIFFLFFLNNEFWVLIGNWLGFNLNFVILDWLGCVGGLGSFILVFKFGGVILVGKLFGICGRLGIGGIVECRIDIFVIFGVVFELEDNFIDKDLVVDGIWLVLNFGNDICFVFVRFIGIKLFDDKFCCGNCGVDIFDEKLFEGKFVVWGGIKVMFLIFGNFLEMVILGNFGKDGILDGKCGVKCLIVGRLEVDICLDGSFVIFVGNIWEGMLFMDGNCVVDVLGIVGRFIFIGWGIWGNSFLVFENVVGELFIFGIWGVEF